jgi:hypothetical protein
MSFGAHLEHTRFWPSADVQPNSDDLVYAMPWECANVLSVFILQTIWL